MKIILPLKRNFFFWGPFFYLSFVGIKWAFGTPPIQKDVVLPFFCLMLMGIVLDVMIRWEWRQKEKDREEQKLLVLKEAEEELVKRMLESPDKELRCLAFSQLCSLGLFVGRK